jgi:hypothetical protein
MSVKGILLIYQHFQAGKTIILGKTGPYGRIEEKLLTVKRKLSKLQS